MNKLDFVNALTTLEDRGFTFQLHNSEYSPVMLWEYFKQYKAMDDHLARAEIFQRSTRPDNA